MFMSSIVQHRNMNECDLRIMEQEAWGKLEGNLRELQADLFARVAESQEPWSRRTTKTLPGASTTSSFVRRGIPFDRQCSLWIVPVEQCWAPVEQIFRGTDEAQRRNTYYNLTSKHQTSTWLQTTTDFETTNMTSKQQLDFKQQLTSNNKLTSKQRTSKRRWQRAPFPGCLSLSEPPCPRLTACDVFPRPRRGRRRHLCPDRLRLVPTGQS